MIISKNGNIEQQTIYCKNQLQCQHKLTVSKTMIPEAKILVYFIKNKHKIYQGETVIKIDETGENKVNFFKVF